MGQKIKFSLPFKAAILAIIVIGIAIINGCGKQSPMSPDYNAAEYSDPFASEGLGADWSKVYSFGSGEADILDSGADFKVPSTGLSKKGGNDAGVSPEKINITCDIGYEMSPSGINYIFDFGPDGLSFNPPAALILHKLDFELFNPTGVEYSEYVLNWYNPDTGEWELEKVVSAGRSGKIIFPIHHFSRYSVGGRNR
ncbi:MAG: hypothetical protein GY855_16430 [candidate division Zixibacteria bacterium]|nr:hypothetical protein [candidate division Zixibacteria bacterium]